MQENNDIDYNELSNKLFKTDSEIVPPPSINVFEDFDDSLSDIDFSQFKGKDFKSSFKKVNKDIERKSYARNRKKLAYEKKPLSKNVPVKQRANVFGNKKQLAKVIVPRSQEVIVQGVSKFILSNTEADDSIKNIGYYKGKKLKKLILTFNNDSAVDFNLELFNPSMPLDYYYSTTQNLNDKIQVAGGAVSYSDVLFNILANPTLIPNATFVFSGPLLASQMSQALGFKNKSIDGEQKIHPINLNLSIDIMQVQSNQVYFNMNRLNRPFIPDGMDVITYKVLAGMTITMCFYYRQVQLKKLLLPEARESKDLL